MSRSKSKKSPRQESAQIIQRVVIDPAPNKAIEAHCFGTPRREVCGVLVGFIFEENARPCTRIVDFIEGQHAREEQMSVTFTHQTWDAVHEALAKRTDKARVVGWYHTHPDFGIFYSVPDIFVHKNFFGSAGQVGLVIDPIRNERGVFIGTSQGLRTLPRYEVAKQNKGGHMVTCKYVAEPLRDELSEAKAAASTGTEIGYAQSTLDSIESNIAQLTRSVTLSKNLLILWIPLIALLAFTIGFFIGQNNLNSKTKNAPPIELRVIPTNEIQVGQTQNRSGK